MPIFRWCPWRNPKNVKANSTLVPSVKSISRARKQHRNWDSLTSQPKCGLWLILDRGEPHLKVPFRSKRSHRSYYITEKSPLAPLGGGLRRREYCFFAIGLFLLFLVSAICNGRAQERRTLLTLTQLQTRWSVEGTMQVLWLFAVRFRVIHCHCTSHMGQMSTLLAYL